MHGGPVFVRSTIPGIADPRILSWGTETETDCEYKHSIGLERQKEGIEANRKPAFGATTLHSAERTVCSRLIRFSWQ